MKRKLFLPIFLLGCATYAQTIELETFATNIISPVEIVNAGTGQLFVAGQNGVITLLEADGTANETPFFDISMVTQFGGEQGLLGLAFHPDYATNGYFYIDYIDNEGNTVVARYTRNAANPDIADPDSALFILGITQQNERHQGGCLRFGPEGYLYISTGDSGVSGNGQNINTKLGKILRIDVDNGAPYSIPATNPFVNTEGADEIWAYGLRNPWKFSFDASDNLWIADVGEGQIEEVDKVSATEAGLNYGWTCYEGNSAYDSTDGCPDDSTLTFPFAQYTHAESGGCSITGGYVYSGTEYPNMQGKYFFADYCTNKIGWIDTSAPGTITWSESFAGNFTTIGEDNNGELYIGGGSNGTIYKITDVTAGIAKVSTAGVFVYPNPAHNEVFVDMKNTATAACAKIYDLSGKCLIQQTITANLRSIDTSALQAGIYLLEINTPGNKIQQKLVIN